MYTKINKLAKTVLRQKNSLTNYKFNCVEFPSSQNKTLINSNKHYTMEISTKKFNNNPL